MWVPVDVTPRQVSEHVSAPSTADGEVREVEGLKPAPPTSDPTPTLTLVSRTTGSLNTTRQDLTPRVQHEEDR